MLMGFLALAAHERVASVSFPDDSLRVGLMDGRTIIVPWSYPKLLDASQEQ